MSPLGKSLHEIGMECCDKGCPVEREDGVSECHCNHTITVEKVETPKDPISKDNENLLEPECKG